ncbi:MAG: hypothetical protein ACM3ME_01170 [Chloroflexota bacterium]
MFSTCTFIAQTGIAQTTNTQSNTAGTGEENLYKAAGEAMWYIQTIGVCLAVLVLAVYGIQWFVSSPQDKAALKAKGWVYILGMILLLGGTTIASFVMHLLSDLYILPVKETTTFHGTYNSGLCYEYFKQFIYFIG